MSERYGTRADMPELLEALEDYCQEQINTAIATLRAGVNDSLGDPRYDAGRKDAYEKVLQFIIASPGG